MKNRLKLCAIFLILAACSWLGGSPRPVKADALPLPPNQQKCPPGQQQWCVLLGDGGPFYCYCAVKP
jgi:hypothetical protein